MFALYTARPPQGSDDVLCLHRDEEGGEHLRKRSMHLPFTYATGEALLYQANHPIAGFIDDTHEKNGGKSKKSRTDRLAKDGLDPGSLLGALMSQDESVYVCQPALEPKVSFHSSFLAEQMGFSSADASSLRRSWDETSNGVVAPGATQAQVGTSFDPLLATLDSLSLEGQGILDSDEGGCSNGELFGALEGLGLSAEDLELLLLDERMIRVEMDPERVPTLEDLLTNDEILSYIYDSIEGKMESGGGGGQAPPSTSSATAPTEALAGHNPAPGTNVPMQFPHHKPPLAEQAPIVQLSQQMQQHLSMRASKVPHSWGQQGTRLTNAIANGDLMSQQSVPGRPWVSQDLLTGASIELEPYTTQQSVFNGTSSELDSKPPQQHTHQRYLQPPPPPPPPPRMDSSHLSQQCHAKRKAANLNGLCGTSSTDNSAGKSQWQDYGFSEGLATNSCLDTSQKPLSSTPLEPCADYSMPDMDGVGYPIREELLGRPQHAADSTVASFQGLNHKQLQESIPVPLVQVISSLSQCPPPNASLEQILGVGKPCRQMEHYSIVTTEIPHEPSPSKVSPLEPEHVPNLGGL